MSTIQSLIQFFYEGGEDDELVLVELVTEELGETELEPDVQLEVKSFLSQKGDTSCQQQN